MHNWYSIGERTILNSQICEVRQTWGLSLTIQDREMEMVDFTRFYSVGVEEPLPFVDGVRSGLIFRW